MDALRDYFSGPASSQVALAEKLGCHPSLISQWLNGHTRITAEWAVKVEEHTGIHRSRLRPDLFEPKRRAS